MCVIVAADDSEMARTSDGSKSIRGFRSCRVDQSSRQIVVAMLPVALQHQCAIAAESGRGLSRTSHLRPFLVSPVIELRGLQARLKLVAARTRAVPFSLCATIGSYEGGAAVGASLLSRSRTR